MLQKTYLWSKEHAPAIIGGLVIALLIASPNIRAWQIIGPENFDGVYPTFSDDEVAYQARIKEVIEGDMGVGNPYLKEHMDDPFIMPPIAEWLVAGIAGVANVSVPFLTSVSDLFLTFVNFLLLYVLLLVITKGNKAVALFYTTIFFILSLATFARPISPQINAIPFFIGLIYIAKLYFYKEQQNRRWNLLAGLFTGVTVFLYPYFFTTMLVLYGLLVVGWALAKRKVSIVRENATWFLASFLPFAALFVFFQMRAAENAFYSESVLRYGLMHTHIPGSFTNVALGVLTLGLVMLAIKLLSKNEIVFTASCALSIIVLNWQNVITGKSLQFASHYRPTLVLTVILVLAVVHMALLHKKVGAISRFLSVGIIIGMCVLFLVVAESRKEEFIHMATMPYTERELIEMQEKMVVFDWLNKNTRPDSVVYSLGGDYNEFLPVYTTNKVYFDFYANFYPVSHSEIEERWLIQHLFDPTIGTSTFQDKQREYAGNRFIDTYQSGESRKRIYSILTREPYIRGQMVPEEYIEYMYGRWQAIKAKPIEEVLNTYEIDYVLLSHEYLYFEKTKSALEELTQVELEVELNGELIYRFKHNPIQ